MVAMPGSANFKPLQRGATLNLAKDRSEQAPAGSDVEVGHEIAHQLSLIGPLGRVSFGPAERKLPPPEDGFQQSRTRTGAVLNTCQTRVCGYNPCICALPGSSRQAFIGPDAAIT